MLLRSHRSRTTRAVPLLALALAVASCGGEDTTVDDQSTEPATSSDRVGSDANASGDGDDAGDAAGDEGSEGDDGPAASEDAGTVSIALDGTEVDPGVGEPTCTVALTGGPSKFAFEGDAAKLSVDYDTDAGALSRVALQVARGDGDWDVYRQADGALETATSEIGETQLRGEVTLTPVTTFTEPGDVAMTFEIAC